MKLMDAISTASSIKGFAAFDRYPRRLVHLRINPCRLGKAHRVKPAKDARVNKEPRVLDGARQPVPATRRGEHHAKRTGHEMLGYERPRLGLKGDPGLIPRLAHKAQPVWGVRQERMKLRPAVRSRPLQDISALHRHLLAKQRPHYSLLGVGGG